MRHSTEDADDSIGGFVAGTPVPQSRRKSPPATHAPPRSPVVSRTSSNQGASLTTTALKAFAEAWEFCSGQPLSGRGKAELTNLLPSVWPYLEEKMRAWILGLPQQLPNVSRLTDTEKSHLRKIWFPILSEFRKLRESQGKAATNRGREAAMRRSLNAWRTPHLMRAYDTPLQALLRQENIPLRAGALPFFALQAEEERKLRNYMAGW